jgi:hypothetical protein
MRTIHPITVNGQAFKSISDAAKYYHIPRSKVYRELKLNVPIDEIFGIDEGDTVTHGSTSARTVTCNNQSFKNLVEFSNHYNLSIVNVRYRLKKGDSLEMIAGVGVMESNPAEAKTAEVATWKIDGEVFTDINELAKYYHANVNAVVKRLSEGCSVAQAVGLVDAPYSSAYESSTVSLMVNGKNYPSTSAVSSAFGINKDELVAELNKGESCDDAVSMLIAKSYDGAVFFDGVVYKSERAAAIASKVSMSTYYQRRQRGWSFVEALVGKRNVAIEDKEAEGANDGGPVGGSAQEQSSSISKIAKTLGVAQYLLRYRMDKLNMTLDEAVSDIAISTTPKAKPVIYDGKEYSSIREFAIAFGVHPTKVHYRLNHGWTLKQAISKKKGAATSTGEKVSRGKKSGPREIDFDGTTFKSLNNFAKHYGIGVHKVRYRLSNGWTLAQSVEVEPAPRQNTENESRGQVNISDLLPLSVCNKEYDTAAALAKDYGLNSAKVTGRLRNGWSASEAVEICPHQKVDNFAELSIEGKVFKNARELAKEYGASYRVVRYRLSQGATALQAVGKGDWVGAVHKGKIVRFNGHDYDSYTMLATEQNVNYDKLMGRIHRGWSIEDAVSGKKTVDVNRGESKPEKGTVAAHNRRSTDKIDDAGSDKAELSTSKPKSDLKSETKATIKPQSKPKPKLKAETKSKLKTEPKVKLKAKPKPKAKPGEKENADSAVAIIAKKLKLSESVVAKKVADGWSEAQMRGDEPPPHWQ